MMGCSTPELPPGFRFHPTDEELITHYLRNQVMSMPCPVSIIPELNIYKFDPWQLPEKSGFGEGEWYFFSPRDRKYPNGARPNRATISGYWKATGTDKAIYSNDRYVGVKKALVFYKGRPPKGSKTGWIMHEYRLSSSKPRKPNGSMRLDDWVLCRIYEKQHVKNPIDEEEEEGGGVCTPSQLPGLEEEDQEEKHHLGDEKGRRGGMMPSSSPLRFPRTSSLMDLLEAEYMSLSEVLNGYGSVGSSDDFHAIASNFDTDVFIGDNDDQLFNTVNFLDDNHQKQKQAEQPKFWSQVEER